MNCKPEITTGKKKKGQLNGVKNNGGKINVGGIEDGGERLATNTREKKQTTSSGKPTLLPPPNPNATTKIRVVFGAWKKAQIQRDNKIGNGGAVNGCGVLWNRNTTQTQESGDGTT